LPLYEYRCLKCGHVVELLQKLDDPPLRRCALCAGRVEKLISRTSFQLKGGGWYAHGYDPSAAKTPSGGEAGEAKSDKGAAPKAEKVEGKPAKTETKPDAKVKGGSAGGSRGSGA
jgi:putative FmdB family regulatory protein